MYLVQATQAGEWNRIVLDFLCRVWSLFVVAYSVYMWCTYCRDILSTSDMSCRVNSWLPSLWLKPPGRLQAAQADQSWIEGKSEAWPFCLLSSFPDGVNMSSCLISGIFTQLFVMLDVRYIHSTVCHAWCQVYSLNCLNWNVEGNFTVQREVCTASCIHSALVGRTNNTELRLLRDKKRLKKTSQTFCVCVCITWCPNWGKVWL